MRYLYFPLVLAAVLHGQSFQGSLRGRIVGPKPAIVSLASITVIDEAAGTSRSTLTSEQGEYTFAAVTPSIYTVVAEAPGSKKSARKGVVLSTQTAVTIDFTLELGQVTEQINVTAEASLVDTADASTGQVIDSQKLTDLSLSELSKEEFMKKLGLCTLKLAYSVARDLRECWRLSIACGAFQRICAWAAAVRTGIERTKSLIIAFKGASDV